MEGFVVPFMKEGERYEGYVQRMRQSSGFKSQGTFVFADTIKISKQNNLAVILKYKQPPGSSREISEL